MESLRLALGSLVRAKTQPEAERVGKYMLRPILAPERLTLLEAAGRVGYRHGEKGAELETKGYREFIARVTSHIPDKGSKASLRTAKRCLSPKRGIGYRSYAPS